MALPHKDDKARCESLLPTSCPEKAQHRTEPGPKRTMSSRRLAVALFLCFLVTYGFAAAISPRYRLSCNYHHHGQVSEVVADEHQGEAPQGSLSTLLNSVSPDALHRMLHTYFPDRYQHGIYESDRQAVEAVHANNPALASSIVQIAKRQGTNSTSPTQTSTSTTTPASSPTTAHTTTTTETSTSTSVSPTTTTPSSTSTTTHGPDTTSSTTQTTPTTSAKKSSSLVTATFTSTAPNGQATVVTATSYVEANPSPTGTTGAAGSIQTGNSAPGNPAALPAWAGIILGGLLLI